MNRKVSQRQAQLRKSRIKASFAGIRNIFSRDKKAQNNNTRLEKGRGPDKFTIVLVAGLTLFGWIMIYSGSFFIASQKKDTLFFPHNPFHFFILQGVWILISVIAGYIVYKIPYKQYKSLGALMFVGVLVLLVVVLLLAKQVNGAKSWLLIGGFSLQPSELAKPALILYLAGLFSKENLGHKFNWREYIEKILIPFIVIVGSLIGLVLLGGDLGSTGVLIGIAIFMFFLADSRWQHTLTVAGLGIVGSIMGVILTVIQPYRLSRVQNYLEFLANGKFRDLTDTGYQLFQTILAVGSGGLFGYGFGQSRQKYNYLQETAFSDTIFAVIAEEFGLLGSILVIAAFAILCFRGIKIAQSLPHKYPAMLAIGVTSWIFIQTIIHLGVNVGLIPLTGLTLPFLSYGGSSLLACFIGIGILLNVSKEAKF